MFERELDEDDAGSRRWGFVIVATEDEFPGRGQTILGTANSLLHANSDSDSIFYHKLNSRGGRCSQGASRAADALVKSTGLIKTVTPIELRANMCCTLGPNCINAMT